MHPCLFIAEIVQYICDEIHADNDTGSLYALARTCRNFQEPALASLWKEISDLVPIIQCAGRDLWEVHIENRRPTLRLSRQIQPPDLATMKKYGRLVRRFGFFYKPATETSVAPDVWGALRHTLSGTILFSNIWGIIVYDQQILESIALFSVRCLTSVWFECDAKSHVHMLANFFASCPNLKRIDCGGLAAVEEQQILVEALAGWPNLIQFVTCDITLEALKTLSAYFSNSLRYLTFNYLAPSDDILYQLKSMAGTEPLTFPALEQASYGVRGFSNAIAFLDYFPSSGTSLQNLSITVHESASSVEADWLRLLQLVKNYSHSLRRLRIEEGITPYSGSDSDSDSEVDSTMSLPELSNTLISVLVADFKMLTAIEITHVGGYDINDEDLKYMTESLPRLEVFRLIDSMDFRCIQFKNTIASLVFFAQNCPVLSHLALGFDGRTDKVPKLLDPSIRSYSLRVLDVSSSPVDDPKIVAGFLTHVFPNLHDIRCMGEPDLMCNLQLSAYPWYEIFGILNVDD